MKYFEMLIQRFNNTSKKNKIIIVVILLVSIVILANSFNKYKVDEQRKLEMEVDNYIERLENTDYSYYMSMKPEELDKELGNKDLDTMEYQTIMIKYNKQTISQLNELLSYCEREKQKYTGNTYKELEDEIEYCQLVIKYINLLIDSREHFRDKVILFNKKKISEKKVIKYREEFFKEKDEILSMIKLELKTKGLEYIDDKFSGNNTKDIKENFNTENADKEIKSGNKEYYTPIEVYNNQGVNGKYKDSTETKKYVIQSEEVEYWEEEYIYIGTYKKEDNKLCIEYSSRYKYDETENKYVLAGGGYTTMFKLGKDYEELTIKSEDELVTSNGVKYLKEYPSNNTNNSIFSSKPNTNIQKEQEPITQLETPKLVKTYNTIKSEGKTEYNIIKILQYENGDYTYEIYWHSYGETTPSIKSKERFKTIDETLKYVIQNFEGYKLTMNDLTEE